MVEEAAAVEEARDPRRGSAGETVAARPWVLG